MVHLDDNIFYPSAQSASERKSKCECKLGSELLGCRANPVNTNVGLGFRVICILIAGPRSLLDRQPLRAGIDFEWATGEGAPTMCSSMNTQWVEHSLWNPSLTLASSLPLLLHSHLNKGGFNCLLLPLVWNSFCSGQWARGLLAQGTLSLVAYYVFVL